jgi:hypothetical protein
MMDAEKMIQAWPFPVGEGPFHIKGTALKGVVDRVRTKVPGGLAALLARAKNPALDRLLSTPILVSSWYDVFALCVLDYHTASVANVSVGEHVFNAAHSQFVSDMNGIYRMILRVLSPQLVVDRIARVTGNYFDFGPTEVKKVDAHAAEIIRRDFPELLTPWYGPVAEGYTVAALEATGASQITRHLELVATGHRGHDVALVDMRLKVSWR